MKLRFKEDPKEWRKQAWLAALGLAVLSSVLRWRHVLTDIIWLAVLAASGVVALGAWLRPRWFRSCYRFSMRLGFAISQFIGFVALVVFFFSILMPMALLMRLAGKDPLRLKRPRDAATYWLPAKESGPLDRLF